MRMSFHSNMMMLHHSAISESFMNTFLRKLGAIVFLFQSLEESMKNIIGGFVEIKDAYNENYNDKLNEALMGDRSFKNMKLLFSRVVYAIHPDADETIEFNITLKRLSDAEEQRNKYIHSVYWFVSENKVKKGKSNKAVKNPKTIYEHVNFKDMDKFINELFELNYELKEFHRIVAMRYNEF